MSLGFDPEVPAGYQDADIEGHELARRPCMCGTLGPDEFGNYDLLESLDCPLHGAGS